MALSGSFYTNVNDHWRLQLEWSGSQSTSGNYTNITAKLYWIARDGYGAVRSSASKTASISIGGTWDSKTASGMADLSGNQKKRIHTFTKRINHSADGTASVTFDGWFDAEVTLSGTYYSRIGLSARTYTLNTIPRESSITSSASWTAGNNRSVSISRHSTKFHHDITWQVKSRSGVWNYIRTYTANTYTNGTFTTSQHKEIFQLLDGRSSADSRVFIATYDGTTKIGDTVYKYGTVTAPKASKTFSSSYDYNIEGGTNIGITRYHDDLYHKAVFTFGSFSKTLDNIISPADLNPTQTEIDTLHSLIPNSNSIKGTLTIYTYYEGIQVRSSTSTSVTLNVTDADPTFSSSQISYADTNTATATLTGDNTMIVQGQSVLTVYVDSSATAKKGASMDRYVITANGKTYTISTATGGSKLVGAVDASKNITMSVRAVDSRGNSTTVSKSVIMIPYQQAELVASAERQNNFETATTLTLHGKFSEINIGGTAKNIAQSVQYRYRQAPNLAWSNFYPFTYTTGIGTYDTTDIAINLDNAQAWDVEFKVTDKISSSSRIVHVGEGKPILFIDAEKSSIGVNVFPQDPNSLEVAGNIRANEQIIVSVGNEGTSNYGLQFEDTGNIISYWSGGITVYGNQTTGNALFRVRGHEDQSNFGTDFVVFNTGHARFYHNLAIDGDLKVNSNAKIGEFLSLSYNDPDNERFRMTYHSNGDTTMGTYSTTGVWQERMKFNGRGAGTVTINNGLNVEGNINIGGNSVKANYYTTEGYSGSTSMYLGVQNRVRVTDTNYWNGGNPTYQGVTASDFNTVSLEKYKEEIHEWNESALDQINQSTIYEYYMKRDIENGVYKKRQGLVIGAGYNTPTSMIDEGGIEQYRMNAWSWKAIQELSVQVKELKAELEALKS